MQRDNIYYINGVQVNVSMYDICIDCYNTAMNIEDQTPNVSMIMSLQHFKKMCNVMNAILQDYEKNICTIELPNEDRFKMPIEGD